MIFELLQVLKEEVNNYLGEELVILNNIATIDEEGADNGNNPAVDIFLTLINIQEEHTLKNIPNYTIQGDKVAYKNPKVNLNLCILFAINNRAYDESLKSLSKVIEFFQGKRIFTQANANYDRDAIEMQGLRDFEFVIELFTPSFEELNYIWGTLGGKQYPSVMYKLRVIEIERDILTEEGKVINQISSN